MVKRQRWIVCGAVRGGLSALAAMSLGSTALAQHSTGCAAQYAGQLQHVVAVTADGDLKLGTGGALRLSWLDRPENFKGDLQRRLTELVASGRPLLVRSGATPDRWGRLTGVIDTEPTEGGCISLQSIFLREGLVRVRPGFGVPPDATDLSRWRADEAVAIKAGVGIWGLAGAILPATVPEEILRREGEFVIVDGVVVGVGVRAGRTYINFGKDWFQDLTISAPARVWREMVRNGWSATTLAGKRVRARGIVESRGGPLIELSSAAGFDVMLAGRDP